ncbi:MAG: response regulator transcription factor [bacterium]|nr:response regulator transcription factor [bacterium]
MKVLYVEDDATAREFIHKGLQEHGHVVDTAADGETGLERGLSGNYDLIILDVGLPGIDGFEVLTRLRDDRIPTPVLFLSARTEVSERIRGLNLGADDYLAKPFAFAELLARIDAISRRTQVTPVGEVLQMADLELDLSRHIVRRADQIIELTRKEFALLEYLMRSPGQVLSRTMIIEKVWGYSFDSYSNVIDVHIAHLRKKIDRDFEPKLLHTVKGMGYILDTRPRNA